MLTDPQRAILAHLDTHGEASLPDLAKALGRGVAWTTKDLDALEAVGLVDRNDEATKSRNRAVYHRPRFDYDAFDVRDDLKPRILELVARHGASMAASLTARLAAAPSEVRATCEALREAGQLASKKVGSSHVYRLPDAATTIVRHVDPDDVRDVESSEKRVARDIRLAASAPWAPPAAPVVRPAPPPLEVVPDVTSGEEESPPFPVALSLLEVPPMTQTQVDRIVARLAPLHELAAQIPHLERELEEARVLYEAVRERTTRAMAARMTLDEYERVLTLFESGVVVRVEVDAPLTAAEEEGEGPGGPEDEVRPDLAPSGVRVLAWLEDTGSALTPRELHEATGLGQSTVHRQVGVLLSAGLVQRELELDGVTWRYRAVRVAVGA